MSLIKSYFLLESNAGELLTTSYEPLLIIFSYLIAIFSGYTTLSLIDQMRKESALNSRSAKYWWLGASFTQGSGIFAMHFIGMLAFSIPVELRYDIGMTLVSLIAAIGVSAFSLWQIRNPQSSLLRILLAALFMGIGISVMHYAGMAALIAPAMLQYEPGVWILSILIALSASLAALLLYRYSSQHNLARRGSHQLLIAFILGSAISGMHYTGMAAANFYSGGMCGVETGWIEMEFRNLEMGIAISIITSLIIGIGLIAAIYNEKISNLQGSFRNQNIELKGLREVTETHAIVSVTDLDGNITYVNNQFCNTSGFSEQELIGNSHNIVKSGDHDDAFYHSLWETILAGKTWEGEIKNSKKGGDSYYWVKETIVPFLSNDGTPYKFISIQTDITHLKHVESELTQAKELAERSTQAKSDFLANMSHELRTPLTAIIGNSELISEFNLSEDAQELIRSIEISARSQLSLVNDILDISKIEAEKFNIDEAPYDLQEMLQTLRYIFSVRAQDSGITFTINTHITPENLLVGDRQRLTQVLINLISNAIKFTTEGAVILEIFTAEDQLIFSVEDTGIGISEEALKKLFVRFEQADNTISSQFGGTGLGLYISHQLIQLMGGSIDVTSTVKVGSQFVVRLPYQESEIHTYYSTQNDSNTNPSKGVQFSGNVLVVEDTPTLRIMEARILSSMGIDVSTANNGAEAVEMANSQAFDLILMDMQMPVMNGIEATEVLRAQQNRTPIVALTANVMQKHREIFEQAGVDGFIEKPIDRIALRSELEKYLTPVIDADTPQNDFVLVESTPDGSDITNEEIINDEMMELFQEFITSHHKELTEELKTDNWQRISEISHTIKGSGSMFGFPRLTELGEEICLAVERGDTAPKALDLLLTELKSAERSSR